MRRVATLVEIADGCCPRGGVIEANVEIDRALGHVHGLHDRYARLLEQLARALGLVDAGDDERLGVIAEERLDGLFLLELGVANVQHQRFDSGRTEHILDGGQIIVEDAIGQRGDDDAHDIGASRGQRARQVVRNVVERGHGGGDALA